MGFFNKAVDFFTGGIGGSIVDTVKAYFPPSMSDKEKSDLSLQIGRAENDQKIRVLKLANEQDAEFNKRIKDMEGTAGDLKTIPVVGHVILFLRGCQRPAFGIFTLIMDYQVMSGAWDLVLKSPKGVSFVIINILVLTFLFGERAVKNIMPLILEYFFGKGKSNG